MEELLAVFQYHCHPNLRGAPGQYPMAFPCHGRFSDENEGTLSIDIEKLSEFARERMNSSRYSDGIYIKGLPWKIVAKINAKKNRTEKWLGFYLLCTAQINDAKMICKCSVTYRIVLQNDETEDFTKECDHVFNNRSYSNGFAFFITLTELMEVDKGFYDKDKDKVTLAIDFNELPED
ncbi:hypothetical protein niasHS_008749 [Heterodera schachtii]|uniref:MATH domain-containing protein n=1 Tax=Heterodera schachtii TaxID=97005 RepID=A0ABD2J9X2_HETSC